MWACNCLTQNCQVQRFFLGCRRVFRVSDELPALSPGVNMRSSMAQEGKNSMEQQGAGDGCQTDNTSNRRMRSPLVGGKQAS